MVDDVEPSVPLLISNFEFPIVWFHLCVVGETSSAVVTLNFL